MRALGFRTRLALFFVATLIVVQSVTALLAYATARRQLVEEGGRQLSANAGAFVAQMNDLSNSVANSVQIMSLDFALRSAIGARDRDTILSALRNHGRRVGAARMQLVALDGRVEVDTATPGSEGQAFAFPDLLASAFSERTAAVAVVNGKAFWIVVAPVYAPQPVGLVAASIPVDDALIAHMQELSALPRDVELATPDGKGHYTVVARGSRQSGLTARFDTGAKTLPAQPTKVDMNGREYLVLAQLLRQPKGSAAVYAVLGYSLDDALRPYRAVGDAWLAMLGVGLLVGLFVAWLVARGVARPVEALAAAARRIAGGDYENAPAVHRHDEIGDLAVAFRTMGDAVRERERDIRHQATHDGVTGLPNRSAAEQVIDDELSTMADARGAVLVVGINRLTDVVKTMGHALADRLVRDAALRLGQVVGLHYVARATDTQFLVWMRDAGQDDAVAVALRIVEVLTRPYQEVDVSMDMGAAVGIAIAPTHGIRAAVLLPRAEVAEFAGVRATRGFALYDPATDPHRPERLSLMSDLRAAIEGDALELWYQPKMNLRHGAIDGAEALVRWQRTGHGMVSPELFIGIAEETGNIGCLTRWVLDRGIGQAAQLVRSGTPVKVAINLSARDIGDLELPGRVAGLLARHGLPAASLALEVTESAVMSEPDAALQVLRQLADMDIEVAIDDFGVGQTSFAYLRRLPVRELKIDKMFVQHLATDETDRVIVRSLVELGHRLGYQVTAEGVEDGATLRFLQEIGCDHAQGFFIERPMPFTAFTAKHGAQRTGRA